MSSNSSLLFEELIKQLSKFSSNDLLVSIQEEKILRLSETEGQAFIELKNNPKLKGLLRAARLLFKQQNIHSLCYSDRQIAIGAVDSPHSPLILYPCTYFSKVHSEEVQLEIHRNQGFINPFLSTLFEIDSSIFPDIIDGNNVDSVLQSLIETLDKRKLEYRIIHSEIIGNFHPDRHFHLRELKDISKQKQLSNPLKQLIGENIPANKKLNLGSKDLLPSDKYQKQTVALLEDQNAVLQGPPGTGKSQLLTNIIGKALFSGYKTLVTSEKIKALDLVQKKLSTAKIGAFVLYIDPQLKLDSIYQNWKETWLSLENYATSKTINLERAGSLASNLDFTLERLRNNALMGGLSFGEFKERAAAKNATFSHYSIPSAVTLDEQKELCIQVFEQEHATQTLALLQKDTFQDFKHFKKELGTALKTWSKLQSLFALSDYDSLQNIRYVSSYARIYLNEKEKPYFPLILDQAKRSKYAKLKQTFHLQEKENQQLKNSLSAWIALPTIKDLDSYIEVFSTGNILQKFRLKKRINALSKLPIVDLSATLIQLKSQIQKHDRFLDTQAKLLGIGIANPLTEFSVIDHLIQQLDGELIQHYSYEQLHYLAEEINPILNFCRFLDRFLHLKTEQAISDALQTIGDHLEVLMLLAPTLKKMDGDLYTYLQHSTSLEELESSVLKSNWIKFQGLFPELAKLSPELFQDKIQETLEARNLEQELFPLEIIERQAKLFADAQALLIADPKRLKANKRSLRSQLKKGKAILVKEFSKSKMHLTLQDLYRSDAALWLDILSPVVMTSPQGLAQHFPLERDYFDLLLVDEASQIELSHAMGALYRSKRCLIAGDEKQLNPFAYFESNIHKTSLLHQASFYLKNQHLQNHYRSTHPDLIAFSNRYFYNGSLHVFPKHSAIHTKAITIDYCENGLFETRCNRQEAERLVSYLRERKTKNIGVVTFSTPQMELIWSLLSAEEQDYFRKCETEGLFFLKTLDQVQGDECDELLISFAYAKNRDGKFNLRFGALNQHQGLNRLNVLLSRAKENIRFFTSVKSSDFKWSNNEAVNLLRSFLATHEGSVSTELQAPWLNGEISGDEIHVSQVGKHFQSVEELLTFHQIFTSRGWKIRYSL